MAIEYLLLENSDNILLEDGVSLFLLESSSVTGEVSPTSLLRIDSWEFSSIEPNAEDRDPIDFYISWQMMDNGVENLDKEVLAIRATCSTSSDGKVQIHGFEQGEEINREDVDDGLNALYEIDIPNATIVTRHRRVKGGSKNMAIWTPRFSGTWDGTGEPSRLDELVIEYRIKGTKK